METTHKTIGQDLTIFHYSVEQIGYGRQALYLMFVEIPGKYYFQDVFPNVEEHFDILLREDAAYNEDGDYYTNSNGNGEYSDDEVFNDVTEALNAKLAGREIEIEIDNE